MSYPIQKAGSASDVTTKNQTQTEYGNILAQQLAVEAGLQTRVTYSSGGAGASSTLLITSKGNTLFTIEELKSVVANIVSNTATNAAQATALAAAATRKLGITVNLANNIVTVIPWSPRLITGLNVWLDGADPLGTGTPPANGATVSTWADKSGNTNNTTSVVGTPTYSSTSGIVLNGSSYFNLPNGSIPFNNTSYTIYSVVNVTSGGWFGAGAGGGSQSLAIRHEGSSIRVYWFYNDLTTTITPSTGTTFLFATQYQTGGQRTIFINGTAAGSDTPGTRSQPNTGNLIGTTTDGNVMTGSIRDILVYNTNHTTLQRQQMEGYLAWKWGLQIPETGDFNPIIRLLLETDTLNTGTTSATRPATNNGSVTVGVNSGQLSASFTSGKFISVPFLGITQAPFSISYWFNTPGGDYDPWTLSLNSDWVINPDIVGGQNFYTRFTGATVGPGFSFSTGWNHVTLTIDATATTFGVMKSYLNGVLKGTVIATANGTLPNAQFLYVGKSDARIYVGSIRRFRVHDFVLSQAQITSLYNQELNILQSTHPYFLAAPTS
jgi:hypothetical protein